MKKALLVCFLLFIAIATCFDPALNEPQVLDDTAVLDTPTLGKHRRNYKGLTRVVGILKNLLRQFQRDQKKQLGLVHSARNRYSQKVSLYKKAKHLMHVYHKRYNHQKSEYKSFSKHLSEERRIIHMLLNMLKTHKTGKLHHKSCKGIYNSGARKSGHYHIYPKGKPMKVYCNKGWTLVQRMRKRSHDSLTVGINDKGLSYRQVKFVNRGSIHTWNNRHKRIWKSHGLDVAKTVYKLNGRWYKSPFKTFCKHKKFRKLPKSWFKITKRNGFCYWRKQKTNLCGNEVIINTHGRRMQGIADAEGLVKCYHKDNYMRFYFDVYVR